MFEQSLPQEDVVKYGTLDDSKDLQHQPILHELLPHPCPLNTLIGDPSDIQDVVKKIELKGDKPLFINASLSFEQEKYLKEALESNIEAFSWEYKDMRGIQPNICTHHIYTKDFKPMRQPQRIINPFFKDFMKKQIDNLLQVIFPISGSQWISPLAMVPKKNGNWRVCLDFKNLIKPLKYITFPYHSLIKFLIALWEVVTSLSWMVLVDTIKSKQLWRIKTKLILHAHGKLMPAQFFPLASVMLPQNFKELFQLYLQT